MRGPCSASCSRRLDRPSEAAECSRARATACWAPTAEGADGAEASAADGVPLPANVETEVAREVTELGGGTPATGFILFQRYFPELWYLLLLGLFVFARALPSPEGAPLRGPERLHCP